MQCPRSIATCSDGGSSPQRLTSVDAEVSGTYPIIHAEDGGIPGGITDRIATRGGAVLVIEVDDVDATLERVLRLGGRKRFPGRNTRADDVARERWSR